jgi:hypothetical protein
VQALQEVYIRKVIDTVQDLPNVLYEVANESSGGGVVDEQFAQAMGLPSSPDWGDSTEWQYWVINSVKEYERRQGYMRRPIGMTMQFPVADQTKVNETLFNSPADWISPGYDDEIFAQDLHPMMPGSPLSRWADNPPASDGRKVIISDTDHYAPPTSDSALWAWKSFLRGSNPILMDFAITDVVNPPGAAAGLPPYAASEPARYAMGDTRRYAERMGLVDMEPRNEVSSTEYALANAGEEYLILQPNESADPFVVTLEAGAYAVEWYSVNRRATEEAGTLVVASRGSTSCTSPFAEAGPAVLYLKRVRRGLLARSASERRGRRRLRVADK